jgi:hypothetical protein
MEILNFGPSGSSPKKRRNRVALVVGALALAAIGSTFAASISLNNGSSIEYGQGLSQAVACDASGSVTINPQNTFINATGGGAFNLETLTVTDINTANTVHTGIYDCAGKYLKVTAYQTGNNNTPVMQCDVQLPASYSSTSWVPTFTSCGIGGAVTTTGVLTGVSNVSDGFQLVFTTPSIAASSIAKFTLESHS